jgi:hypothetical protein
MENIEDIIKKYDNDNIDRPIGSVEGDAIFINPKTLKYFEVMPSDKYKDGKYYFKNTLGEFSVPVKTDKLIPEGQLLVYGKSNTAEPEMAYSPFLPFISTSNMPFYKTIKRKIPKKELKANISHARKTDPLTLVFTLTFLKDRDEQIIYSYFDDDNKMHNIIISLSKSYKDGFGFKYRNLDVWHQNDETSDMVEISTVKIPDSYKGWSDCVAYMHGIYRDSKDSCYDVTVRLDNGYVSSEELEVV